MIEGGQFVIVRSGRREANRGASVREGGWDGGEKWTVGEGRRGTNRREKLWTVAFSSLHEENMSIGTCKKRKVADF